MNRSQCRQGDSLNTAIYRSLHRRFVMLCLSAIGILCGCSESRLSHYQSGGFYFGRGPAVSPDGKHIVFSSPCTGNGDIYQMSIDGSESVRLTSDPGFECDADYSADGKDIVFVRESSGEGDLWIMKADGSSQRQLTKGHGDEGNPRFAPDGHQIVFWRTVPGLKSRVGASRARELFLLNITSGVEERLTNNEWEDVFPVISPLGDRIGFVREDVMYLMNRDGKNEKVIGEGGQFGFSPNGEEIAFVAGQFGRQIDTMGIDGANRRVIYSRNTTTENPSYMPGQSSLIFLSHAGSSRLGEFTITSLDGSTVTVAKVNMIEDSVMTGKAPVDHVPPDNSSH